MSRRSLPPITHRSPPAPAAARTLHAALLTALLPTRPIAASTHRRTNRRTARSNEIAHPPAIARNVYGSHPLPSPRPLNSPVAHTLSNARCRSGARRRPSPPPTPVLARQYLPMTSAAHPARQSPLHLPPASACGPACPRSQGHTCIMTPA